MLGNNIEIVSYLLEHGLKPYEYNNKILSQFAVNFDDDLRDTKMEILDLLIEYGADFESMKNKMMAIVEQVNGSVYLQWFLATTGATSIGVELTEDELNGIFQ